MDEKKWYHSKTMWINIIAIIALIAQSVWGFVLDAEDQLALLGIINLILRLFTGIPISGVKKS